jgi:hypothetical protein
MESLIAKLSGHSFVIDDLLSQEPLLEQIESKALDIFNDPKSNRNRRYDEVLRRVSRRRNL